MDFLDFLDNVEKTIDKIADEPVEDIVEKTVKNKKTIQEKNYNNIDIKEKLICELNRFGLNKGAIDEIVSNIFNENIKVKKRKIKGFTDSNFKENVNKLKKQIVEDKNPITRASTILDGIEDMPPPEGFVNTFNFEDTNNMAGNNQILEVKESELNMDDIKDHASALLL